MESYSELKAEITSWSWGRTDIAAKADLIIDMVEADLNNGVLGLDGSFVSLRTREMEAEDDLTPDSDGQATLPTDYLEFRQVVSLNSPRRDLKLISLAKADEFYADRVSDLPDHFTIIGSTIQVLPISTTDIRLHYYQKIPALSSSNTTNWLLTKAPNVYLYGCLRHADAWFDNPDGEARNLQRFLAQVHALNASDKGGRWSMAAAIPQGVNP